MNRVFDLARLSKARRLKVGCELVDANNRPINNGYNGTPPGWDNECEYANLLGAWSDKDSGQRTLKELDAILEKDPETKYQLVTKAEVGHAEANLIGYCAAHGLKTAGSTLYITDNPCMPCCVLLGAAGIRRIVYSREYRDQGAIDYCKKAGIKLEKYEWIVET